MNPATIQTGAETDAGVDHGDPYRVLVADDEPANLKLLGDLLLAHGYEVFAAPSGEQALSIAADAQPDVVLLDVVMPGLDGFETCRRLKSKVASELPVIFLTARRDTVSLVEGFEAGGSDYVTKPFDTAVLLARVRTHAALGRLSRNMQQALDQRTLELRTANQRLTTLSRELAATSERERRLLAEQLHDGPIQDLALARIQIETARNSTVPAVMQHSLASSAGLVKQSLDGLRSLLFDLSPPAMSAADLPAALQRLAAHVNQGWPLVVDVRSDGDPVEIDEGRLLTLFRATRELIINAAKHAGSERASILLHFDPKRICIVVEDHGQGFDAGNPGVGFGLASVRERLAVYDGTLALTSGRRGTRAAIHLPVRD